MYKCDSSDNSDRSDCPGVFDEARLEWIQKESV